MSRTYLNASDFTAALAGMKLSPMPSSKNKSIAVRYADGAKLGLIVSAVTVAFDFKKGQYGTFSIAFDIPPNSEMAAFFKAHDSRTLSALMSTKDLVAANKGKLLNFDPDNYRPGLRVLDKDGVVVSPTVSGKVYTNKTTGTLEAMLSVQVEEAWKAVPPTEGEWADYLKRGAIVKAHIYSDTLTTTTNTVKVGPSWIVDRVWLVGQGVSTHDETAPPPED